jgi:hypothetical protein
MNHYNLDCFAFKHRNIASFIVEKDFSFLIENLTHATITNLIGKGQSEFLCSVTEQNVSKTVFKIIILFSIQFTTTNHRTDEHYTSKLKSNEK